MESLECALGTTLVIYVSQLYFKKKQIDKLMEKEIQFVLTRGREQGKGNWLKVVKGYRLSAMRLYVLGTYSMINMINNVTYYILNIKTVNRVNPKIYHHKE